MGGSIRPHVWGTPRRGRAPIGHKESFQTPRFRVPVLLFKRRQPYYYVRDREMGWGTRSEGGVEICEMHCQYIEVQRLPHVQIIGQKLASRLQRIRDRRMQSNSVGRPKVGHTTQ